MQRSPLSPLARAALATMLVLAAGCASVVAPSSNVPDAMYRYPATAAASHAARDAGVTAGAPMVNWWQSLHDPMLDELVTQAMRHNHGLQAALAAVRAARGMADAAARDGMPRGALTAEAQRSRAALAETDPYRQGAPRPPAGNAATLGQTLTWEADLFGRIGTAAAVAGRHADMAAADAHGAAVLLQGEVVRVYTLWRHAQQDLQLLEQASALHARRAAMLQVRADSGLADRRAALAARHETTVAEAGLVQLRAQVALHEGALSVLAGQVPAMAPVGDPAPAGALPAVPDDAALRYPDDLLARRPDVAKADARLRAAMGSSVLAERAHLPRLSLNLSAALLAPFGQLGSAGAVRYGVGPALSWEWLDAGRNAALAAAAGHEQRAAWHQFEQTVLSAIDEGEASLRLWSASRQALSKAQAGEDAAQQLMRHSQQRADAGLEPFSQALEHTIAWHNARRATLAARAEALHAFARVQLALGAWQPGNG
ncbi:TolC family protein [Duganella sp. FT92W]|uniref:TolC family protein n=1 Tax=Pseudoduganella rivuli TaxID=2666085 RepID=A0A7X2IL02_9BURK|nr:TolC family protein [Pseudoduganella rivuli]MRV71952.1 TolC family protein [Pseudoduganella rivuli]